MAPDQIRRLTPLLDSFLAEFDDCFPRADTRAHLPTYVQGLLSDLPRKSVEPIALHAGVPPRTLQQFLSLLDWDQDRLGQRVQQLVGRDHASPHAVGIIDDTGCPKKGDKTPGVQRQWCGATGKLDNCVVTVHLSYAAADFHCLLDGDLYLPQSWAEDRPRCRQAGIPDTVVYRPKWRIALELYDGAVANGLAFAWLTCDENYGNVPDFLRGLHRRRQRFVTEVPISFQGWLRPPRLRCGPRGRLRPSHPTCRVDNLARYSPTLRDQEWVAYRVKDGHKGPIVWEVKHALLYVPTEDGDPTGPWHLLVARNALDHDEVKYFVSNAPRETSVPVLLLVAFSRWHAERCFQDEKTEMGFDHYEGRSYRGLLRHQRLTALAHVFCSRVKERLRGEKSGGDGVPGESGGRGVSAVVVGGAEAHATAAGTHVGTAAIHAATERGGARQPHEANAPQAA